MSTKVVERGDHVVLAANEEEGWPQECGWVLEVQSGQYEGMLLVGLCSEDLESGDDGLREVSVDQVEEVTKGSEVD